MTRKLVAGLGLIAAWSLFAASQVVFPGAAGDGPAEMLAFLQRNADAALRGTVLWHLSALLFAPALVAIATLVRGRGATLAVAGASVFALGVMGHAMLTFRNLVLIAMAAPEAAPDQMAALMERVGPANFLTIVPLMYLFEVGAMLLAGALWRAGLVPVWPLALFAVAALLFVVAPPEADVARRIAVQVPATAAAVWIGLALLRLRTPGTADAHEPTPTLSHQLGPAV